VSRAVGVLGGAFNPPHLAHLLLAQEAVHDLDLDELVMVPTGIAPHKRIAPEPGAEIRLEMARLAVAGVDRMSVSDLEVAREGPSFAFRTLELLADELPGSELTFVMGADVAAGLERWERPERVLELARVAIAERPGFDRSEIDEALTRLGAHGRIDRVEMPALGISSSMIRDRIARGKPVRWLVPDPGAQLISDRGLYREGGETS
jgi:nicotinate-nucleotide adenylyltransferase